MDLDVLVPIDVVSKSCATSVITVCIVLSAVSWITVALRFWIRIRLTRNVGWDDICISMSLILFTGLCTLPPITYFMINEKSAASIRLLKQTTKISFAEEIVYIPALGLVKVSLGLFFLRITIEMWQRRMIYILITLFSAWSFAYFWISLFQCGVPAGDEVFRKLVAHQCLSQATAVGLGFAFGVASALVDIMLVAIPIVVVTKSNMDRHERVAVVFILTLAIIGCVASMIRLNYVHLLGDWTPNVFNLTAKFVIWSILEPGLGIIASSLATFRPLFRKVRQSYRSSRNDTSINSSAETDTSGSRGSKASSLKQRLKFNFLRKKPDQTFESFDENQNGSVIIMNSPLGRVHIADILPTPEFPYANPEAAHFITAQMTSVRVDHQRESQNWSPKQTNFENTLKE